MRCKNLKELEKVLREKIDNALLFEVADTVVNTMQDHIITDVYSYTQSQYIRRGENGGLGDTNNMFTAVENMRLTVENIATGNPYINGINNLDGISENANSYLTPIIESGLGYDTPFKMKRPFIENTIYDLEQNKQHVKALKQGLKKLGLEVK